jgi:nucleotide-binding universal stress UspA family protein
MKPIIVGIDGSQAAIAAALWGIDEAISRAVPLRLISVMKQTHPSPDNYARDTSRTPRHRFAKHNSRSRSAESPPRSKPTSRVARPDRCSWRHRATPR